MLYIPGMNRMLLTLPVLETIGEQNHELLIPHRVVYKFRCSQVNNRLCCFFLSTIECIYNLSIIKKIDFCVELMEKFNYKSCDHQLLQKKRPTRIVTTCPLIINLIPTLKGIEQIPTCPIVVLLGGPQPSILCKYMLRSQCGNQIRVEKCLASQLCL